MTNLLSNDQLQEILNRDNEFEEGNTIVYSLNEIISYFSIEE